MSGRAVPTPAVPDPAVLELAGLSVARGGRVVVDRVSASIAGGGITAVVGPNGAGKSSLLAAVAGVLPHGGTVTLAGRPVAPAAAPTAGGGA